MHLYNRALLNRNGNLTNDVGLLCDGKAFHPAGQGMSTVSSVIVLYIC